MSLSITGFTSPEEPPLPLRSLHAGRSHIPTMRGAEDTSANTCDKAVAPSMLFSQKALNPSKKIPSSDTASCSFLPCLGGLLELLGSAFTLALAGTTHNAISTSI